MDTTYIGGFFEKVDDANTTKHKCYINSPTGRIAIYTQTYDKHTFGTTYDTKYCHRDHLGSVDVITDATGAVLERDSFDAWGFRRTTDWQLQRPIGSTSIVSRGFTDHEELDSLGLVNMNGRIYDPGIGRFMSGDPFVQFPFNTQNFNRYTYVLNNPLSFTDPSGFGIFGSIFGAIGGAVFNAVGGLIDVLRGESWTQYWHDVVTAVVSAVAYIALAPAGPIVAAFGAGFVGAFTSTMLSGARLGQALEAGAITGGIAAATQGALDAYKYLSNAASATSTVSNTGSVISQSNPSGIHVGLVEGEASASEASLVTSQPIQLEMTAEQVVVTGASVQGPAYQAAASTDPLAILFGASAASVLPRTILARSPSIDDSQDFRRQYGGMGGAQYSYNLPSRQSDWHWSGVTFTDNGGLLAGTQMRVSIGPAGITGRFGAGVGLGEGLSVTTGAQLGQATPGISWSVESSGSGGYYFGGAISSRWDLLGTQPPLANVGVGAGVGIGGTITYGPTVFLPWSAVVNGARTINRFSPFFWLLP